MTPHEKRLFAVLGALVALSAPGALVALSAPGALAQGGPPDLSRFTPLLSEEFDTLRRYDGFSGLWSTALRRRNLVTNGPCSVFLPGRLTTSDGATITLDPFEQGDGTLKVRSGLIPPEVMPDVRTALADIGQDTEKSDCVRYFTGRISTEDTLGLTYGYFEIRARVPKGKGHWPAFWLAPATDGWPPEIDIFEAYGRGLSRPDKRDDTFIVAVYFDDAGPNGEAQRVDIDNPFARGDDGGPQAPVVQERGKTTLYKFNRTFDARDYGIDIYDEFATWAVAWTPEDITFYFGRDHDTLREIFKTPTPDDLNSDMNVIVNDQLTSRWGWNPIPAEHDALFAPDNVLEVDYVRIDALVPERGADLEDGGSAARVVGTPGDDLVKLSAGGSIAELGGGADTVFVPRTGGTLIVDGAGPDDRLVLDGFYAADAADAHARLTQVGADVWLADGVGLFSPQTLVLRDVTLAELPEKMFVVRWPVTRPVFGRRDKGQKPLRDDDGDGVVRAEDGAARLTDAGTRGVTLVGSAEGDEYEVRRPATEIVEAAGGGVDTVRSTVDFALPDNVENLVAVGKRSGLLLTGNAAGNRLEGNGHTFRGMAGDDLVVAGGGGNRIVIGPGEGHDRVEGFGSADVIELDGIAARSEDVLARLTAVGGDTVLSLGTGASVTLVGVAPSALGPANVAVAGAGPALPPAAAVPPSPPGVGGPRGAETRS